MNEARIWLGAIIVALVAAIPAAAQWQPQVHVLHFNEGVGTTTLDTSAAHHGLPATFQGSGMGWELAAPKLGAASLLRSNFDPANLVRCPSPTTLSGSWTIEFWMRDDLSLSHGTVFGFDTTNPSSSLRLEEDIFNGSNYYTLRPWNVLSFVIPQSVWTHVALVYDLNEGYLAAYVNGAEVSSWPITWIGGMPPLDPQAVLEIGGWTHDTTTQWMGALDEFRIWDVARTPAEIQATMNQELEFIGNQLNDVAIEGLYGGFSRTKDENWTPFGAAETLSFRLTNYGQTPIAAGTMFSVGSSVNGAATVTEVFTSSQSLASAESEIFSFQATGDFSVYGEKSWTLSLAGTPADPNDVWTKTWASGTGVVTSFPFVENFDSLPAGTGTTLPTGWTPGSGYVWENTLPGWTFADAQLPTWSSGPAADHGTGVAGVGHYAVDTDSGTRQILTSPVLDLTGLTEPRLEIWVYDFVPGGGARRDLAVQVADGDIYSSTFHPRIAGGNGTGWDLQVFDLSAYAGQVVMIHLYATGVTSSPKPVAIDDLRLYDFREGPGQPHQLPDAYMDINLSRSPGGLHVISGENGPYTAHATPGGNLDFDFYGRPFQHIALLAGPLNPVAATFPVTGQMDIGGLPDPVTGVPVGIQVLANGFVPATSDDLLFILDAGGARIVTFPAPFGPPGSLGGLQALFATTPGQLALSNAIELILD